MMVDKIPSFVSKVPLLWDGFQIHSREGSNDGAEDFYGWVIDGVQTKGNTFLKFIVVATPFLQTMIYNHSSSWLSSYDMIMDVQQFFLCVSLNYNVINVGIVGQETFFCRRLYLEHTSKMWRNRNTKSPKMRRNLDHKLPLIA